MMSSGSDNKDAAWTFLEWLQSSDGGEKVYTEAGEIFPALQSVANSPAFMTDQPPANKEAFIVEAGASGVGGFGYFPEWGSLSGSIIEPGLEGYGQGKFQHKKVLRTSARRSMPSWRTTDIPSNVRVRRVGRCFQKSSFWKRGAAHMGITRRWSFRRPLFDILDAQLIHHPRRRIGSVLAPSDPGRVRADDAVIPNDDRGHRRLRVAQDEADHPLRLDLAGLAGKPTNQLRPESHWASRHLLRPCCSWAITRTHRG